ncbi:MAG TPA: glycosyltransferase [Acidobacteriaceae bacterium]|nr:glycosyltransferase [Acidobacteriaceae bacterium]
MHTQSENALGAIPNALVPQMLREAHVALFPNRAEGGTNLVAMEAMACGIPVVLSANTGHLDLIRSDNCYVLTRQSPVSAANVELGTDGWGESDPEEIVTTLEAIYTDWETAQARAAVAAKQMASHSWRNQIGALFRALG